MPSIIEQFTADSRSLDGTYPLSASHAAMGRFEKFDNDELARLASLNFDSLSESDRIDYLLLKNRLTSDLHRLAIQKKLVDEMQSLLPFSDTIESLLEDKRLMKHPDGEKAAAALTSLVKAISARQDELDPKKHDNQTGQIQEKPKVDPVVANRAIIATTRLATTCMTGSISTTARSGVHMVDRSALQGCRQGADRLLNFLKEKLIGIPPDDKTTIIGDPVGREALLNDLADNMIPYTPEELIAIAQTKYDWCMKGDAESFARDGLWR